MADATFHFPRGFLWGAATSSHQVEGNNKNNQWWAWEQQDGRIFQGQTSGMACDWWNGRWRDDFDRAMQAGQNAHRLSIEWSRVQPIPDRWDEEALDRYLEILKGLNERGMVPLVTLHHFSEPLWFTELGGWEHEDSPSHFNKYAGKVVETLKDYASYWVTINEPNVYAFFGYVVGDFPPGKKDIKKAVKVIANMARAHAAAFHTIHNIQPESRVGAAHHYRGIKPASWSPLDHLTVRIVNDIFNESFPRTLQTGVFRTPFGSTRIEGAKESQDYFGLNYYTQDFARFNLTQPGFLKRSFDPDAELSETGFLANMPQGFSQAIQWADRFKLPILITENGIDDSSDKIRPSYLVQHLHQMWRAVNFNIPVKGYFHWTLVDNFEWERGWSQRFGLWELDPETQERKSRPSASLYSEICRINGLSADMVARYAPAVFGKLFPN